MHDAVFFYVCCKIHVQILVMVNPIIQLVLTKVTTFLGFWSFLPSLSDYCFHDGIIPSGGMALHHINLIICLI